MTGGVAITILVDNQPGTDGLVGEEGFAVWMEADGRRVLFDSGLGGRLAPNAASLGIDLATADAIVVSHGHADHTGGMGFAMDAARHATLFLHPAAIGPRYSAHKGTPRQVGWLVARSQLSRGGRRVVWTSGPGPVVPGVFLTGEVPRVTGYEDTGGSFTPDAMGTVPDPICDDQSLFINTPRGTILVMGCAHSGVINTLNHVRRLTGRPIHAVIGGMHLLHASDDRISRTVNALADIGPSLVAPGHCTGPRATAALRAALPECASDCRTGARWTFAT